jgi:hypothetical protein
LLKRNNFNKKNPQQNAEDFLLRYFIIKTIMKNLFIYILLLCSFSSIAQEEIKIPRKIKKSVDLLAPYITDNLNTTQEKIDSVYSYITHTIAYDYKKITSDKPFNSEIGKSVLKSKKATCTGYCELTKDMLSAINVESEIVYGYIPSKLKDTIVFPTYDSHSWLAIKMDNKWYLTDPTWDAGYIGSIRTNKIELFKKKWEKHNEKYEKKEEKLESKKAASKKLSKTEKIQKRLDRLDDRKIKSTERLERKEINAKDFTGKTGFVQNPKKDWYMIHPDSFLIEHLPSNPMWQLKKDTIGCSIFAYGKKHILNYVKENTNGHYHFNENIEDYRNLDILERLIWNSEDAFKYNPKNFQTKAINYYTYVSMITNKKVQKEIPDKYKMKEFSTLLPMVDTARTYAKLAIKSEKGEYKFAKKYYKILNKKDQTQYKKLKKATEKGLKQNDKAIKNINKTINRLRNQNSSLEKTLEKRSAENNSDFEIILDKRLNYLKDSLDVILNDIAQSKTEWETAVDSNHAKTLIFSVLQNRYLLNLKNQYIGYNDYNINNYISELDSIIDKNNLKISEIYTDSLPVQMLSKDIYTKFNALIKFNKNIESELSTLKEQNKISNTEQNLEYFNRILTQNYDSLIHVNQEAVQHNVLLKHTLEKLKPYWDDVKEAKDEQEAIIETRYETNIEEITHENERQKTMFEKIKVQSEKWKAEFKLDNKN